jgi:putative membrane protein
MVFNTEFIARNITYWLWLIPAGIISFALEAYAVATGAIFGQYSYGEVLGLKLYEVPIIIGLNWVMVIWGAYAFASLLTKDLLGKAFITGAACVAFDYFLEPVAIALGFWNWQTLKIPAQNYLAWFGISFVLAILAHYLKLKNNTNIVTLQFTLQFLLFLLLNIFI